MGWTVEGAGRGFVFRQAGRGKAILEGTERKKRFSSGGGAGIGCGRYGEKRTFLGRLLLDRRYWKVRGRGDVSVWVLEERWVLDFYGRAEKGGRFWLGFL